MSRFVTSRRSLLAGSLASLASVSNLRSSAGQVDSNLPFGILGAGSETASTLALFDADTGEKRASFAIDGTPVAAWRTPLPGVALVRTDSTLNVVDGNNGEAMPIAVPAKAVADLSPVGIQFRGSASYERILIGTPFFNADTYIVDLLTGERIAVVGLLAADKPPQSLQNVSLSADQRRLMAWDGRTTWIVDIDSRTSRVVGSGQFTFSAGFSSDGVKLAYSQQMSDGSTQLLLEDASGATSVIGESASDILVSLWLPGRDVLLLDERTDAGGTLAVYDPATDNRQDLLDYNGATSLVQLSPHGRFALVSIEGEGGRDWYQLALSLNQPVAKLLPAITNAVVSPGFDFHAAWALALPPIATDAAVTVNAVDLATGVVSTLISGLTNDAEISAQSIAPSGNAAVLTIDSFTEFAIHYLRLDQPDNLSIDIMKGGSAVIAPDGERFAISFGRNVGGEVTIVYDRHGSGGASFPGHALAWI
jgi:hypothetical protein